MQNSYRTDSRTVTKKQPEIFTSKLEIISTKDSNPHLSEMKYRMDMYKAEVEASVKSRAPIEHETFKKSFYPALENLLQQIKRKWSMKLLLTNHFFLLT